jgi:hypothetical protein
MRRRDFIKVIGSTVAWPLAVRAQQGERIRHIGVLMPLAEDDPEGRARVAAFLDGLRQVGINRRPERQARLPLGWNRHGTPTRARIGTGISRARLAVGK